ncbi:class I SAM-dependent methyltransferase [Sungkyunkwania multivorans]|uniref:Class I SAM-dependent methyltransferase n=1 Tax=Sungkyunkwania multivorans TaxID=1173618 RepID=A0ABW3D1C7_9FLAO
MEEINDFFETNRETWNEKVSHHAASEMYDLDAFKQGRSSLKKYELDALGEVNGKSLLHLQCHFGQDTLSFSRMGARCTGIDISDKAIKLAQQLNDELALDAHFICCNTYDVNKHISEAFDIVFTSYGVIGWLPDLKPWGKIIASRLKPGGTFFMAEFHPIVWMFDYLEEPPKLKYGYHQKEVIYEEYEGTYADERAPMTSKEYGWNHGLGEVVTALTEAGLEIEYLKEHEASPYDVLPNLVATENELFVTKDKLYPLIFTIKATKP